jgi:isoleucyl-tRNA synthetase
MSPAFKPVPAEFEFPKAELATLEFWKSSDIFHKSIKQREGCPAWVFYEGPPTANGKPHHGHVLTRVIKDIFCRYRTMTGSYVPRKAGWDTHGLPVEVEIEKELKAEGLVKSEGKAAIEEFGVEPFVRRCMDSVFKYTKEWEQLTERIGFWIDLDKAYVTYTTDYVESVWWALAEIYKKGLLDRGHKSLPWCPRCATALSSHEVGLGYRMVEEDSVFVAFRTKKDPKTLLVAWTTTPWTLPSNLALAVRPEAKYAKVKAGEETLIMAEALVATAMGKVPHEVIGTMAGRELVGTEYEPLYPWAKADGKCYRVLPAEFVSVEIKTEEGEDGAEYEVPSTGIVHIAPGYGQEDYELGREHGLPVVTLVGPDGKFGAECGFAAGKWFKDTNGDVIKDLKKRGLLLRRQPHKHRYPHCWRCETPLIYLARGSWFIRTTKVADKMLANNGGIDWHPEHIKTGRFGKFLETNIDWALSRERYWGTPLPIWKCEKCGFEEAHASKGSLLGRNSEAFDGFTKRRLADPLLSEHLAVHLPFIDEVTYRCPKCGKTCRRVAEVIDCWFDAGCMPFAQWGWPHIGEEEFKKTFPADFITEAIDQTRGWFYAMLAIGTLVHGKSPYKSCLVLGHVGDKDGKKLSKHLKNYTPLDAPGNVLETMGADAVRWFFASSQPQWNNMRFYDDAIKNAQREFIIKVRDVYKFFIIYANIDGFDPAAGQKDAASLDRLMRGKMFRFPAERTRLDRYALAELAAATAKTRERLEDCDIYGAAGALTAFVDTLSNWYVRRSRDRFWSGEMTQDKADGYWTLYECLTTLARLMAPFTPFAAEELYQNLARNVFPKMPESVHLCDYPAVDAAQADQGLLDEMNLVREIVTLGGAARAATKLKRRQPLSEISIVPSRPEMEAALTPYAQLIADELSVKKVSFIRDADQYVTYEIKPNFRAMGPRFGAKVPGIKEALSKLEPAAARRQLAEGGALKVTLKGGEEVDLTADLIEVRLTAREGYAAAQGKAAVCVLNAEITPELAAEGLAREIIRAVQSERSEQDMAYTARIDVTLTTTSERVKNAVAKFNDMIRKETLAEAVVVMGGVKAGAKAKEIEIDGEKGMMAVEKVK